MAKDLGAPPLEVLHAYPEIARDAGLTGLHDAGRLAAVRATRLLDSGAEESFDRLTRLAAELLDVPYALVTLVDERRCFWKSCFGIDESDPALRQQPVKDSFCQYVVASGEPLLAGDTANDPRTAGNPSITALGAAAWAGFPMRGPQGEVLGTLCVVDTRVRTWSDRDARVLETLAAVAGNEVALRAALAEAHTATLESLAFGERNAELARVLVQSMLPPTLPEIPGLVMAARYLPGLEASEVLGDFYEVFPVPGGWAVLIGDVCGHGPEAASVAATARHTIRALAMRELSPRKVLGELNTVLLAGRGTESRFLSAVLAVLTEQSGGGFAVTLCSAGHTPTLLLRPDDSVVAVVENGILLGCFPDAPLVDVVFDLRPGDGLALYTDGVLEALRDGQQFGDEALHHLLADLREAAPSAVVDRIIAAVTAHTGTGLDVQDDVAVLVLKVAAQS